MAVSLANGHLVTFEDLLSAVPGPLNNMLNHAVGNDITKAKTEGFDMFKMTLQKKRCSASV